MSYRMKRTATATGGCLAIILVVLLVIAFFILGPLAVMWALNQLKIMSIEYTFMNWLATFVLLIIPFGGSKISASSNSKN